MKLRYFLVSIFIFAALSVIATRLLITNNGLWGHYDYYPKLDMDSYREYFFSMFKWFGGNLLDQQKRIVLEWIYLFITERQEQVLHFTALAFITLSSAYLVCLKLLEKEKYKLGEFRLHVISFAAAFFYFANPISISNYVQAYFLHSYALFPLLFYSIYMTLRSTKLRYPVMFGFLSAFLFLVMVHNILYMGVSLLAIFIVMSARERSAGWLKDAGVRCLIAAMVFFVLTAFMLLPVAYITLNRSLPQPGYVNTEDYVARLAANAQVLRLMVNDAGLHPWAYLSYKYPFEAAYFPLTALITIGAAAACLLRPSRLGLAALLCIVLFVFLGKSVNSPFGGFYNWIIFDLPFFGWLFRGGQKFAYVLPFFFSLAITHALAQIGRKEILAVSIAALLVIQGVFAWPAWTGNFANKVVKGPLDAGFLSMNNILKNDTNFRSKVAWYAGYMESAAMRLIRTGSSDVITMRGLIDRGRSVEALEKLDKPLGIDYLVIGPRGGRHYFYSDYAYKAVKDSNSTFDKLYGDRRFFLYRTENGSESMYIPQTVMLDYSGFASLYPLMEEKDDWSRTSVIFADNNLPESLAAQVSDTVVFGPEDMPALDIDDSKVIRLGKYVNNQNSGDGWVSTSTNLDYEAWHWLRVLDRKGLESDQWLYGKESVFTSAEFVTEKVQKGGMEGAGLGIGNLTVRNLTVVYGNATKMAGEVIHLNATIPPSQLDVQIKLDFLNASGGFLGTKTMPYPPAKAKGTWAWDLKVPDKAAGFRIMVVAKPKGNKTAFLNMDINVSGIEHMENTFSDGFTMPSEGDYSVYLRTYMNPQGGSISARIDGLGPAPVKTLSNITGFTWVKVYDGPLEAGTHSIAITNVRGFNAVNVAYYIKDGDESGDISLDNKTILYVLEAESDFETAGAPKMNGNYSRKAAVALNGGSGIRSSIRIYKAGDYSVSVAGENVSAFVDGTKAEGKVFLASGRHSIELRANGSAVADYAILSMQPAQRSNSAKAVILDYERTGPTTYKATVNSTGPYFIVLTEDYDELWRASVDGNEFGPISVYGVTNGFYINRTGLHEVSFYYGPQPLHDAGIAVSGIGYAAVFVFLAGAYLGRWNA